MKKIFGILLVLIGLASIGWIGGSHLWKLTGGNTLEPAMSNWNLDIGNTTIDTLYLGSKRLYENGNFLYSPDRIKSNVELFSGNDVKAEGYFTTRGWLALDYDDNDSATYISFHNRDTLWADTLHNLRWGGNSFLGDSGKTTTIGKGGEVIVPSASLVETTRYEANAIKYNISTGAFYVWIGSVWSIMVGTNVTFRYSIYPYTNNTRNIGNSSHRWHDLQIAGSIVDSTGMISGSGTFPATYTCDTFLLSGVVSTDIIQTGWKGATIPNKPLTAVAGTDTIFIYCDVSDTTKARAEGFTYIRFNHK